MDTCLFRTNEGIYVRMKVRAKVSVTFTLTFLHGISPPHPQASEGANRAANECVRVERDMAQLAMSNGHVPYFTRLTKLGMTCFDRDHARTGLRFARGRRIAPQDRGRPSERAGRRARALRRLYRRRRPRGFRRLPEWCPRRRPVRRTRRLAPGTARTLRRGTRRSFAWRTRVCRRV